MKPVVLFDLDGVLADFDKEYFGEHVLDDGSRQFDESKFEVFVREQKFLTLDVIDGGRMIYNHLFFQSSYQVTLGVLSSTACMKYGCDTFGKDVARQKLAWLARNFHHTSPLLSNANFVRYKGLKKDFAAPNTILIDDSILNVNDFNAAGGIGIHFTVNHDPQEVLDKVLKAVHDIGSKLVY